MGEQIIFPKSLKQLAWPIASFSVHWGTWRLADVVFVGFTGADRRTL